MDLRNMGFVTFFVLVSLMSNIQQGVMAFKEIKVGGVQAWHVPDANYTHFYDNWASSKRFHVGDSLRFEYKNDSVLVVDKYGYYHCETRNATISFNDGNTIIKLEHPGLVYFISGSFDHCSAGQRLQVGVMSSHPHAPMSAPPQAHDGAEAPAPGAPAKSLGSHLVDVSNVSLLMGLVVVASMLLF